MIKKKEDMERGPIEIDLTGPEGNAFFLLARAKSYANQIWGDEDTDEIAFERNMSKGLDELYDIADGMEERYGKNDLKVAKNMGEYICAKMRESDYENLLQVFDKYFGSIVTLYR